MPTKPFGNGDFFGAAHAANDPIGQKLHHVIGA